MLTQAVVRRGLTLRDESLDFADADTSWGAHGIHPYPAMMIYPIARRMIHAFTEPGDLVLDPFVGSGTVLVECLIAGRVSYGFDINPLAILLSKVKTTPIPKEKLAHHLKEIERSYPLTTATAPRFFNIDYWFGERVIEELAKLRYLIFEIREQDVKDFFLVAFSETVRTSSYLKPGEFKLYRRKDFRDFHPNVKDIFLRVANRNILKLTETYNGVQLSRSRVELWDSRHPLPGVKPGSVALILTSPPYGDSRTTVAYGQFSRLSLQWLGLWGRNIDEACLGGSAHPKRRKSEPTSKTLVATIKLIAERDESRALEVEEFFRDLDQCWTNLVPLLKRDGKLCVVVGNRTVKGVQVPTDQIIVEQLSAKGMTHWHTLLRRIPNKRMPLQNSPTNVRGERSPTMTGESIVVLRKL